jgi:hypothetical protein
MSVRTNPFFFLLCFLPCGGGRHMYSVAESFKMSRWRRKYNQQNLCGSLMIGKCPSTSFANSANMRFSTAESMNIEHKKRMKEKIIVSRVTTQWLTDRRQSLRRIRSGLYTYMFRTCSSATINKIVAHFYYTFHRNVFWFFFSVDRRQFTRIAYSTWNNLTSPSIHRDLTLLIHITVWSHLIAIAPKEIT